jgi:hypothetical protein
MSSIAASISQKRRHSESESDSDSESDSEWRVKRRRTVFIPVLSRRVMIRFEDERRDRLDHSLRLLRRQPKFADMHVEQILAEFSHLLDIPEPPTILVNPNAPITVA